MKFKGVIYVEVEAEDKEEATEIIERLTAGLYFDNDNKVIINSFRGDVEESEGD